MELALNRTFVNKLAAVSCVDKTDLAARVANGRFLNAECSNETHLERSFAASSINVSCALCC